IELLLAEGREPISASLEPEVLNRFLGEFPYFQLDITDPDAVRALMLRTQPEAVIHTAAFTAVDACESQKELSWRVNVEGTANVAKVCAETSTRLVHVSTEYVFDGESGPYTEDDTPHPISHYGLTKLESEKAVREQCSDWVIGRTTVLFGHAPNVRPSFVAWLVDKLSRGERVKIVDDQVGSPTLADNLAQMLLALLDSDRRELYNTVGDTVIDRYAFSVMAARLFQLDTGLIDRIKTSDLNQPAPRPLRAGLIMEKFKREFPEIQVLTAEQALLALKGQMGL
ncbi:MAG: SDR family oxidoreductase, partial [Chloroflexota bacterium]